MDKPDTQELLAALQHSLEAKSCRNQLAAELV